MTWRWGAAILALILGVTAAGLGYWPHHIHTEIKEQTLERVRDGFQRIPSLKEATLIHKQYQGCTLCKGSHASALYSTSLSPEMTCDFFRKSAASAGWEISQTDLICRRYGQNPLFLYGRWPLSADDKQNLSFVVRVIAAEEAAEMFYLGMPGSDKDLVQKARATGQTVFAVEVGYSQNRFISEDECPLKRNTMDTCGTDYWHVRE